MIALFFVATSSAQAPAVDPPALEITVWGQLAIDLAEDAVVHQMEDLGYTPRRVDGRIVFRPPSAWMGSAVFTDGMLTFRRPVMGLSAPPEALYANDPARPATLVGPDGRDQSAELGIGPSLWLLPSMGKLQPIRDRVFDAVEDELLAYREVKALTEVELFLQGLPDDLDALWEHGSPLSGTTPVAPADRLTHVLTYWATRSDAPEGRRAAETIARWLAATDHTVDPDQADRYEALRSDGLTLPRRAGRPAPATLH